MDDKGFSGELSLHSSRFDENQSQEISSQTTPVVGEAAEHDKGGGSTDHEELDLPGKETLKTMILNFSGFMYIYFNFFKRKHA